MRGDLGSAHMLGGIILVTQLSLTFSRMNLGSPGSLPIYVSGCHTLKAMSTRANEVQRQQPQLELAHDPNKKTNTERAQDVPRPVGGHTCGVPL